MGPFLRDLVTAYSARLRGAAPQWAPLPVQYKDYTIWQQQLLGDESDPDSIAAAQVEYWRTELADVPQPVNLPLDRPRPTAASHQGGHVDFELDEELLTGVAKIAAQHGATAPMVAQAALAVLLHHLGAGNDLTIGSPIEGRADEQLDDLIGFFANTWVLRVDLSGNPTFEDLLRQVRDRALAAYDNQDVPFERLVELLSPDRTTAYQPLFQVMLAWQFEWAQVELPGLRVTPVPAGTGTAKFDLFFNIVPAPAGGAYGRLEYATELFDPATAEHLVDRYLRVLRQVVADPAARLAAVELLTDAERDRLVLLNRTTAPVRTPRSRSWLPPRWSAPRTRRRWCADDHVVVPGTRRPREPAGRAAAAARCRAGRPGRRGPATIGGPGGHAAGRAQASCSRPPDRPWW